jgi:hypothetical protein
LSSMSPPCRVRAHLYPQDLWLCQANACNPFDQSTSILYELAESIDVELTIFDRLGRKVRTLANARQAAGEYSVEWDGRDEVGWVVADGAYFYRLRLGEYAQTRRLMRLN